MFKHQVFKGIVCAFLAMAIFIVGCGGHAANPVDRYMPGDDKRSCASLLSEITMTEQEIVHKQQKINTRDFWNGFEFVAGFFLIVPWFFMDTKGSYEVEIDALNAREKMLKSFFADKGCSASDLQASNVQVTNTNLDELQEQKEQLFNTKNCSECNSLLQKEDGINIYQSKRLCTQCYKKTANS